MRPECPDRTRCLHLEVSVGVTTRLDGPFRRFPLGARQVGRVALERTRFVALDGLAALNLAEPTWLATHRVESFAAFPLTRGDECLGVLALFSQRRLSEGDLTSLAAAARLLALVRIAVAAPPDLRTLAEIERDAIERVLAHTSCRVSGPRGAATILGLKPTTLHSRMRKLGVRRSRPT
jgi:transcriptional regulator with GAF, ATPase, and Fis domain